MDATPKPLARSLAPALAAAAAVALYVWFGALSNRPASSLASDYTHALASGQSYLKAAPNPRLLAARDPFDPEVNRGLRILDASLYHGRYYLFFGLTPFVTLLVPAFLLFGGQPTDCWAITGYCIGAVLCMGAVLADAARRYFPRAGPIARAAALAGAAVCAGGLLLVRSPSLHELEVAAGWFFESAALLAFYRALHGARRPRLALATAGLCAGLAVGARPSHVLFAAALVGFILARARGTHGGAPGALSRCAACLSPLAAVAAALAWFNGHRFGNPLEFGYRYALVDVPAFASSFAGLRNVPYNLWHFAVGLPRLSGWFPFYEGPAAGPVPVPARYYGLEQVYGAAATAPFIACALALFRGWSRRAPELRAVVSLLVCAGALNLAFLTLMNAAVYRYTVDFLPYLAMAGSLGLLALADGRRPGWSGAPSGVAALLLLVFSLASSVCNAFALYDLTRYENPSVFSRVGRLFDEPRLLWEGWRRTPLTQLRIEATLPSGRFGSVNPLLVSGGHSRQNFIYLYYTGPGLLQVGFEEGGGGGPVSHPLPVDYGKPVVFELALGSQWPPAGAWPYHGLPVESVRTLRRRMLVRVNGAVALDAWAYTHPTKGLFFLGSSPDDAAFGQRFEGGRISMREVALPDAERLMAGDPGGFGPVRIQVTREAPPPAGATRQPLVSAGYRNRWQSLSMEALDETRVRFLVAASASEGRELSCEASLPAGTSHTLEFAAGALLPPMGSPLWAGASAGEQEAMRGAVRLSLDGRVILEGRAAGAPEVGPASVAIGENALGETGVAPRFEGQVRLVGRAGFRGTQGPP
jgi:hypothetical protein